MSRLWWRAALVRALKTAGQTLAAGLTALLVSETTNLVEINWLALGSVTLLATLTSLATSLAGLPEVDLDQNQPIN